jgi:hypothetical protein
MLPDRFILRRDPADANKDGNHPLNGFRRLAPMGARLAGGPHPRHPARRQLPRRLSQARPKVRTRFNQAVLEAVYVKDRQLQRVEFTEVFEALFSRPEFE